MALKSKPVQRRGDRFVNHFLRKREHVVLALMPLSTLRVGSSTQFFGREELSRELLLVSPTDRADWDEQVQMAKDDLDAPEQDEAAKKQFDAAKFYRAIWKG